MDFLDISLWDSFKMPVYDQYTSESILSHYGVLVIPTLSTYMVEGKEGALFLEINQVKLTMLERENKKVLLGR